MPKSSRRLTRHLAAAAVTIGMLATSVIATAAPAGATAPLGTKSLASVLASDGDTFDRNWYDYDVLTQAVGAVLAAKPNSPVKVLADGWTAVTKDGSLSAHFEHTVAVTKTGPLVLTRRGVTAPAA